MHCNFNERNIVNNIRIRKQSHSPFPRSPNSAVLPSALSFHLALRAQPRNVLCVYEKLDIRVHPHNDRRTFMGEHREKGRCASNVLTLAIVLLIYLPFCRGSRIFSIVSHGSRSLLTLEMLDADRAQESRYYYLFGIVTNRNIYA